MLKTKDGTKLDQGVALLARAIRKVESNDNFKAEGASGEFGAYQFMPDTWAVLARRYLGNAHAPMSPTNQDKVAYYEIKNLKDKGNNPKQVASIWNSGKPEWEGKKGTNKYGVKYDVPAYVNKVINAYKDKQTELVGKRKTIIEEKITPEKEEKKNNFIQDIFVSLFGRPLVRAGQAITAKISQYFEPKDVHQEVLLGLDKDVKLPFGLGTVSSLKKWDEGGSKQFIGEAMETAAWLFPPVKITQPTKVFAGILFGRGFTMGMGTALQDEKLSITDATIQGMYSGTLTVALGGVSNAISKSAMSGFIGKQTAIMQGKLLTQLTKKAGTKEIDVATIKIAEGTLKNAAEGTILASQSVIKEALKKAPKITPWRIFEVGLGSTGLGYMGVSLFSFLTSGIFATGISGLTAMKFIQTTPGKAVLYNVMSKGVDVLAKVDAPFRNEIATPFIVDIIAETVKNLSDVQESKKSLSK